MNWRIELLERRILLAFYHADRAWADLGVAAIDPVVDGDFIDLASAHQYPDGTVLAVGEEANADVTQPALVRLLPTGALDSSFGQGGILISQLDLGINTVEFASDGSVYAAGVSHDFSTARLAHFLPDGSLDFNFGTGGAVPLPIGTQNAVGMADLSLLDNGKLLALVVEIDTNSEESNELLYRLNSDGSIDQTFGDNGTVAVPVAQLARKISIQPGGAIVLDGAEIITRLLADGSPDSSFGNSGVLGLPINRTKSTSMMLADGSFLTTTSYYGSDEVWRVNHIHIRRNSPREFFDACAQRPARIERATEQTIS